MEASKQPNLNTQTNLEAEFPELRTSPSKNPNLGTCRSEQSLAKLGDGERSRMHGDGVRRSDSDGQQKLGGITSDLVTVAAKNPILGFERPEQIPAELMDGNPSTRVGNDIRATILGNPSKLYRNETNRGSRRKKSVNPTWRRNPGMHGVGNRGLVRLGRSFASLVNSNPLDRKLKLSFVQPMVDGTKEVFVP
ncbi:hypothetical protein Droror1_Dr00024327 [Drosera rotundifolia]